MIDPRPPLTDAAPLSDTQGWRPSEDLAAVLLRQPGQGATLGTARRFRREHPEAPLLDIPALRRWESELSTGLGDLGLTAIAGWQTARWACALAPHAQRIHLLVGPGRNGWDGLWAAWHLQRQGLLVSLSAPYGNRWSGGPMGPLWQAIQTSARATSSIPPDAEVIIDALFGLGQSRPLEGAALDLVLESRRHCGLKLALDLPSGLDPATGQTFDAPPQHVFKADASLAMIALKPGLLMEQGRDAAGTLWWCPAQGSQLPAWPASTLGLFPGKAQSPLRPRPQTSHKGHWGQVLIVGGAPGMDGAGRLASEAALSAGAGKIWLMPLNRHSDSSAMAGRPECLSWQNPSALPDWVTGNQGVVVAGCGAGAHWTDLLGQCLAHARRLVLDADALNLIAERPPLREALQARAGHEQATILTPHPLEAARLLRCRSADIQADRIQSARQLSLIFRCVVVLKGAGTVIADPGGHIRLNVTGGPNLGVGGSGDVLAGWLGGVWAQLADTSKPTEQALLASSYSVWLHGRASDLHAGQRSLPGLDLIQAMRDCQDSAP